MDNIWTFQLPHADPTPTAQISADPDDQIQTIATPAPRHTECNHDWLDPHKNDLQY